MPPLVQSANWQSLARQAGRLLTKVKVKAPNININTTLPRHVARVIQQSFPSLSTPAHLLELNPAYAYTSSAPNHLSQGFKRAVHLNRQCHPLAQATRGFRTARRPASHTPVASNVGLGSARNYSAGPQQVLNGKVPMALRAFASLIDNDTDRTLPRPGHYKPYNRKARISKSGKRKTMFSFSSGTIDSTRIGTSVASDYTYYFPPHPVPAPVADNRLRPEQLVTTGINTVLSIPLAETYHELLNLPPAVPYAGSDLGVRRFADLTGGLLNVAQIIHNRAIPFIIPLLNKLDALGVSHITAEGEFARCDMHVAFVRIDGLEWPDSFEVVFHDRCRMDVEAILGESLRPIREGDWWSVHEERIVKVVSPREASAAIAAWDEARRPAPAPLDHSDLIMPLIDLSETRIDSSPAWHSSASASTDSDLMGFDDDDDDISLSPGSASTVSLTDSVMAEMRAVEEEIDFAQRDTDVESVWDSLDLPGSDDEWTNMSTAGPVGA
jgi:hypothetical protein